MPQVLRSLGHRNFRLFYLGQLVSLSGTWMQNLAQAWLLYRLTGSAFMLGLASAATLLPSLLLGVYGGALADRFSRRNLLMTAQALAMVQALVLAGLTLTGAVLPWQVLVLALLLGVVQALELPARHSLVAQLVPRTDLANAIALNSSLFHAARLVGPAIAGVLVAWIGEGWVFLLNAGTFVAVLVSLRAIHLPPVAADTAADSLPGLWAGLAHVRTQPPVRAALTMVATVALLGSSAAVLLPVFAVEVFATGAERLGLLMGSIGVGALAGALLLAGRRDPVGLESVIAVAGVAVGLALVLFAVTPVFGLALAWLAIVGFCMTSVMASSNAFIQLATPDRLRGRVMALFSVAMHGMLPLGSLMVGALAEVLGAAWTVGLCGALLTPAAFVVGGPLRRPRPAPGL